MSQPLNNTLGSPNSMKHVCGARTLPLPMSTSSTTSFKTSPRRESLESTSFMFRGLAETQRLCAMAITEKSIRSLARAAALLLLAWSQGVDAEERLVDPNLTGPPPSEEARGADARVDEERPISAKSGHSLVLPVSAEPRRPSTSAMNSHKLGASIASAASIGILQRGTDIATEALLECQKGSYRGGGMGALSMPFGRPESRTDHCWR